MTSRIRQYTIADTDALIGIQRACFPPPFPSELWWKPEQIASHVTRFPAGALCAENDAGALIGSATALIIRFDPAHPQHTWSEVTSDGWITAHDANGDTLYGVDIAVVPAARGQGVAKAFYQARFALVKALGLQRFLAGSRISGYHQHALSMSPESYLDAVAANRLTDPVITPQMRAGLRPIALIRDYLPDTESHDCAALMEWRP